MDIEIVENIELARAIVPTGEQYTVTASRHNVDWPGTDSAITFAVTRYAPHMGAMTAVEAVGFFSEKDAMSFLTGKREKEYIVYERNGEENTVVRKGWGVPGVYIQKDVPEIG